MKPIRSSARIKFTTSGRTSAWHMPGNLELPAAGQGALVHAALLALALAGLCQHDLLGAAPLSWHVTLHNSGI